MLGFFKKKDESVNVDFSNMNIMEAFEFVDKKWEELANDVKKEKFIEAKNSFFALEKKIQGLPLSERGKYSATLQSMSMLLRNSKKLEQSFMLMKLQPQLKAIMVDFANSIRSSLASIITASSML